MCKQCEYNPVWKFTNKRQLCAKCFLRYFEKKFLYTLRKYDMMRKGDKIYLIKSKDVKSLVLSYLLGMLSKDGLISIVKTKRTADKIILFNNLETTSRDIIHEMFNGNVNKLNTSPIKGKEIKPLYLFLDKEIILYAKLRNLKFRILEEKKNKISSFIDNLEMKHPDIKSAIVKGWMR